MNDVLINVDLSQAELRTMAILSDDDWMINALQEGQGDFFNNHLMPVAYPELFPGGVSDVNHMAFTDPVQHKELRTNVKAVQYGLAFGRQAPAIAKSLGMSVRDAQTIITNYFDTAPKFYQWRKDVMEAAIDPVKRDLLVSPFGRRFHSELVTPRNMANIQREALSFLPQNTSSDICLSTAIAIDSLLEEAGYKIFNVVHDAIMIQGPEQDADMIGKFVGQKFREVGEAVMGNKVPYLSDYSIGRSWKDLD